MVLVVIFYKNVAIDFLSIAFHVWFMCKAELSTSFSQIIRIVLFLLVSLVLMIRFPSSLNNFSDNFYLKI